MVILQQCSIPQRIRMFYQLTPGQQQTLLDIAEEMLVMNRETPPSPTAPAPILRAVK